MPDDVSVVGFDDVDLAQYVTPPLTSVHQPKLRLGQLAIEMLLKLMNDEPVEDECVGVDLVVRGKFGRPSGRRARPGTEGNNAAVHAENLVIHPGSRATRGWSSR